MMVFAIEHPIPLTLKMAEKALSYVGSHLSSAAPCKTLHEAS